MFVDAKCSQVGVEEQLLWIDVDGRLTLAFCTDVPLRVDQPPEVRPSKRTKAHARALKEHH